VRAAAVPAAEQEVQGQQFGGVGLGRGHGPFDAGAHVDVVLGRVGQRRGRIVGDRDGQRPALARGLERADQVGRTA
jgi:hypothetical protein